MLKLSCFSSQLFLIKPLRHTVCIPFLCAVFCLPAGAENEVPRARIAGLIGRIKESAIRESSGIVASRRHPGIFWTHNDSGGKPELFAIRLDGSLAGRYQVNDAQARDWEDIAIDGRGFLYIGDIGNNRGDRRDLMIYKVREPETLAERGVLSVQERIPLSYPEGNFNCESLIVTPDGELMVISKHRGDARLYVRRGDAWNEVQRLPIADVATGADMNAAHELAVSSYVGYHVFKPDDKGRYVEKQFLVTPLEQCEAICWVGSKLLLTSEQRGLFQFDPETYGRRGPANPPPPWPLGAEPSVFVPVGDADQAPKTRLAMQRAGDEVACRLTVGKIARGGEVVLLFSTGADNDLRLRRDGTDTAVTMKAKNGRWSTKIAVGAEAKNVLPALDNIELTTVKPTELTFRLLGNWVDRQKAFAFYTRGFGDKPRGWPYSYYRVHGTPAFWARRRQEKRN